MAAWFAAHACVWIESAARAGAQPTRFGLVPSWATFEAHGRVALCAVVLSLALCCGALLLAWIVQLVPRAGRPDTSRLREGVLGADGHVTFAEGTAGFRLPPAVGAKLPRGAVLVGSIAETGALYRGGVVHDETTVMAGSRAEVERAWLLGAARRGALAIVLALAAAAPLAMLLWCGVRRAR